jgi:autotransporter adhesin
VRLRIEHRTAHRRPARGIAQSIAAATMTRPDEGRRTMRAIRRCSRPCPATRRGMSRRSACSRPGR